MNTNWYRIGSNISSHLRSKGYNITFTYKFSWITFYLDGEFLFCTCFDIISQNDGEKMLLEILEGR